MYQIVNDSTGIPVARFSDKGYALAWMQDNNTDEKGEYMQLYRIEKVKQAQEASKTARSAVFNKS
jgi:hypothetical protein